MSGMRQLERALVDGHRRVLRYEDAECLSAARSVIPLERLEREAAAADCSEAERRDALLLALLSWFKRDFFSWFNAPVCRCGRQMLPRGTRVVSPVLPDELANHAELYQCAVCPDSSHQFLRYNHPLKLLHTRVGRCGEWANCFALCCRALDWDTRFVEDLQDHVWVEVYSAAQRRWLHCDPCELALDRPHIYEAGWQKSLQYVLACSRDEVADVTFRYSVDFRATTERRQLVSEFRLARLLVDRNADIQRRLPEQRRNQLAVRRIAELVQLLTPPTVDTDAPGRQSGSLSWRLARREARLPVSDGFTFEATADERRARRLAWTYSAATDVYGRDGERDAVGWSSRVWQARHLQRTVEHDWQMAYLCREQGAASGHVSWRVQLGGLHCGSVRLQCPSTVFHSGVVDWRLCGDGHTDDACTSCVKLPADGSCCTVTELHGCTQLVLQARLHGGDGDNAFQHAQLMRAPLTDKHTRLSMQVTLVDVANTAH